MKKLPTEADVPADSNFATPTVYTRERLISAARDHHAYGWTKRHSCNADGSPWTDEQRAIYDAEYDRLEAERKAGR